MRYPLMLKRLLILLLVLSALWLSGPTLLNGLALRIASGDEFDIEAMLVLLNTFPITGPRMVKAAITTIATKTRINAYSTRPWPFSLGANNMGYFLLSLRF